MKRPGIIFTFLSVYIVIAFAWWTYAHIKSSKLLYQQQESNAELLCYKATLECRDAVDGDLARDSTQLKEFFYANFPALEILFSPTEPDMMHNYMIRPQQATYARLHSIYIRHIWMYTLEGLVMMILLFWGIIWVYRSLLSRLQLNRTQNNFLLSITHELKTPVASVKLYLETLQKRQLSKEQSDTIINNSINDANRLRDLVDNILTATQLDSKSFQLNVDETDASHVITSAIDKYVQPRNLHGRVVANIQPEIFMQSDPMALELILSNLLSNAEKYSGPEGKIHITLKETQSGVRLRVCDEGIGISEEDKKNLFNKFHRVGDEHTRKTTGTGLGLFIVKNLLNLLRAEITVKDNQPKGTVFDIVFKK